MRFVLLMGVTSLFADMTYEGGRSEIGALLQHLNASGAVVGIVAGAAEMAGYAIRSVSGAVADRTGRYWIHAWAGYALNMLCVPALALAGSWPAAAGLIVGERIGRGIRRPVVSAALREAGEAIGHGRAFGFYEFLDQTGATVGPLIVAFAIARTGSFSVGFGVLIVPALVTLGWLVPASAAGGALVPQHRTQTGPALREPRAFWLNAAGGALVAAGYADFALIAFRFQRDRIVSTPAIAVWFAVAMAVAAISAPILGRLFDRFGRVTIAAALVVTAAAVPMAFLGSAWLAKTGAALWGLGTAVQDSLLLALVASAIARRVATAYGTYDLVFGVAWFAGSVLLGTLLDRSAVALAAVSAGLQLAAIPVLLYARTEKTVAR